MVPKTCRSSGTFTLLSATAITALLAGSAGLTPALAADLGGNCCADLEERVAELEATAARKGNRRVSLTISGQVSTAVMAWDAGAGIAPINEVKATPDHDWAAGLFGEPTVLRPDALPGWVPTVLRH